MRDSQQGVIAFLSDPASYGLNGSKIERHETHGAIVFVAGDCAWKLKRSVRYPYMDYSTIDARKHMCQRELAVNRRTASDLYLSVRPIVRNENGKLEFGSENDARDAEDWVVVMRRFEQSDLLANMLRRDKLKPALMRELADVIADFHGEAEATPAFGGAASMGAVIDENAALLTKLDPERFRARVDLFNECNRTALERLTPLLDRRRDTGLVRRCHGDLHLNNICMIAGRPVLFDAIEFNDSFSCIDVLYDLAFPLMDLMRHGSVAHANALLNRYLERTQDYQGLAALPFFLACRAGISAHVTVARSEEVSSAEAGEISQSEFRAFVEFGISCLKPGAPCLVAVGGVSGTGKSTLGYSLAPQLAPAPGAIVLRSDIIRKTIMCAPETEKLPPSAYTDEMHERVYSALGDQVASILSSGYSVIADAVFGAPGQRDIIAKTAQKTGAPFKGLWLEAPSAILEQRVAARRMDASDATTEVLYRQMAHVMRPADWRRINAAVPADEILAQARAALTTDTGDR